jgi:trigger factor
MDVHVEHIDDTTTKIVVVSGQDVLDTIKQEVVGRLGRNVRVQGFREGKAPIKLVEKNIDQNMLQTEFLENAVNRLYIQAVQQEKLRPVAQPEISITKFVPYSVLEFSAQFESVGPITLPNYKQIKIQKPAITVNAKDVDDVISNLRTKAAQKKPVKRPAKDGDEVLFDFSGVDAKTKEDVKGAAGTDYPLVLGSKTFIPGFEDNLVGLKVGDTKDFTITFPKDYSASDLRNKKVTFNVVIKGIDELHEPKLDAAFVASVGPFTTLDELKADIKKQLRIEREQQANRDMENDLLEKIAQKTTVAIPNKLIEDEIDRIQEEEKRNLVYRGQTWQEHLAQEGISETQHREKNREGAELRVKAGLVLAEAADRENITVSKEELDLRIQLLKGRYNDQAMEAELDKPQNRRELSSRLLTEKTIQKLLSYSIQ